MSENYSEGQNTQAATPGFKKIRLVTDSTCDLPPAILQRYSIGVAPCFINQGDHSYADDGVQLTRDDFYRQLPHMRPHPSTAAMPPLLAREIIEKAAADADHVIVISVSSKLSGVYNTFRLALGEALPPERCTLVDSLGVSMGMGFQVLAGAEAAEKTGDVQQTLDAIYHVRDRQLIYVALETLEYLRRGGRVSWTAAGVGSLLQIKPIISVEEGEVKSATRVRTFNRAVAELIRLTKTRAPLEQLAILYTADEALARDLLERLREVWPANGSEPLLIPITPTIGVHVGPHGVGVCLVSEKPIQTRASTAD